MIQYSIVVSAVLLLQILGLGSWIIADADARGSNWPELWGAGCIVIPPLIFVYLFIRSRIGRRDEPLVRNERILGTAVLSSTVALVLSGILSPPDPFTRIFYYILLLPVGVLIGYWLVWRRGWARLRTRSSVLS